MSKLSVVLATFNEQANLERCLKSVQDIADEIVIVDGSSTDQTVVIAERFSARVKVTQNHPIFHINKQIALEMAKFEWILQLDADEAVSPALAKEIKRIIDMSEEELTDYQQQVMKRQIFVRHQHLIQQRDGQIGQRDGEYAGFFVPRLNYFLGGFLRWGGVYPDGVIRLVKKGRAHFPAKDVHEQIVVEGRVGWLKSDLIHYDSPTFKRYLERNNRYINLLVSELKSAKVSKGLGQWINYFVLKPVSWFGLTLFRHKGILDGWRGVVFSFFSALRFPRAYFRYLTHR